MTMYILKSYLLSNNINKSDNKKEKHQVIAKLWWIKMLNYIDLQAPAISPAVAGADILFTK